MRLVRPLVPLTLLCALALPGCMHAASLEPLRHDLQRQMPEARFRKDLKLTLGPVSLWSLRTASRLVPDKDAREWRELLSHVRRLELAIYRVEAARSGQVETPKRLQRMLDGGQWQVAVRMHDGREGAWVLYREEQGRIRDIYVAALSADELVLVRFVGRLDEIVAWGFRKHGDSLFGARPATAGHPADGPPEEPAPRETHSVAAAL
jgi:hypothetical protein